MRFCKRCCVAEMSNSDNQSLIPPSLLPEKVRIQRDHIVTQPFRELESDHGPRGGGGSACLKWTWWPGPEANGGSIR